MGEHRMGGALAQVLVRPPEVQRTLGLWVI